MTSLRACSRLLSPLRAGPAAAQFRRTFSTAGAIRSHTRSVPLQHCYRVRYSINSQPSSLSTFSSRSFATSPSRTPQGDQLVAELEELYGTARDEFEIAAEETQGNTVYAASDREAARAAFDDLKKRYEAVIDPANPASEPGPDGSVPTLHVRQSVADEVRSRIGHRIRELENAVENLEKLGNDMH